MGDDARTTTLRPLLPVDARLTLGALRRGARDPAQRVEGVSVWRASRTPDGPGAMHLAPRPGGAVDVTAWGPGAGWLLDTVPELLGVRDSLAGWAPMHPLVADLHARFAGFRIGRTNRVLESLVPAILEQRVTGLESRKSWEQLLRRYGERAPGPAGERGLRVPPPPDLIARIPSWEWHRMGVDMARWRAVRAAARVASRLEEAVGMAPADALTRLRAVPGVGEWTAAETAQRALGDADAVSVGDFHLAHMVGYALTGKRTDDAGMVELLEPYRPQRYRVTRLIELGGITGPRYGPRYAPRDYRAI